MEEPVVNEPADEVRPEVEQFANALDDCLSPIMGLGEKKARLLRLPQIYHQNALRRLEDLEADIAAAGAEDVDMDADDVEIEPPQPTPEEAAEIEQLQREAQTWDLLRRILPLRHASAGSTMFDEPPQDLWDEFLQKDPVAQERYAIVQWLQTNASNGRDIDKLVQDLQQNADRGDVIAHGWLHTRSAIKLRKSVTAWPHLLDRQSSSVTQSHVNTDGALMVTQLDPDAPTRQARKLEPQDEYFERAIWLGCFEHLRRGSSLEAIRDWCQERTEMWRAISMSAMPLSRDEDGHIEVDCEPSSLGLWRRMCYSLARQGGSDDYERAVYGLLSGDVLSVEKVCQSWDDFLFANYNALLRTQLDNFILGKCSPEEQSDLTQSFSSFDAIQYLGDEGSIEKRLISSLESKKGIGNQASEPAKALQAAVISKKIHQHLHEQGVVMSKEANEAANSTLMPLAKFSDVKHSSKFFALTQRGGLRMVAHVYVLVTLLERLDQESKGPLEKRGQVSGSWAEENILAGYTEYLWRSGLAELIPLYCSVLESPRREEVLGCSFIEEDDPARRRNLRKLIDQSGINTVTYVKTQSSIMFEQLDLSKPSSPFRSGFRILADGPPTAHHGRTVNADFFGDEDALDPKHINVVRALEWLLMEQSIWPLAFSYAVKIYKFFLKNMHLNAARFLIERVSFEKTMRGLFMLDGVDEFPQDADFWMEQLEQSECMDVSPQQAMTDARNFRELEALVKVLDNLETMSSLVELSSEMPATNRSFWTKVGDEIKTTKDNMQPLLRGWLLTGIEGGDEELRHIRQTYLPETILAYISALHFGGTSLSRDNLLESMDLATVIAGHDSDLAASFVEAGRMTELVESLTACSKALAVATGEKRAIGASSKKLREKGWARDLWSVKS